MSKLGGYSLDQLLEWCQDDELIDGYDRNESSVVIIKGGTRHAYGLSDAQTYLKGIFTASLRSLGERSDHNEA